MKKKSLLVVATALVLAFAMAACGTTAPTNDPVESSVEESSVEESSVEESSVEEPVADEPVADEPVADEPIADEPATAPEEIVINFVDLSRGGYGFEATVNGDAVDVVIASQYQELQYILPEVIDLASYTTLIIDVTSNSQLDIKLVDPTATTNEYGQLAPFKDNYTAEGTPITEPVYIDLTVFADKDLSQINFMAMGNDTTFTLKSMNFVK